MGNRKDAPLIKFCKLLDATTGQIETHLNPERISDFLDAQDKVIWLDLEDPTHEDLAMLKEEFAFHQLAIEDCQHAHQRPKLEQYGNYVFIVLYEVVSEEKTARTRGIELNIFLGSNYVVTLHRGRAPVIEETERRWLAHERQAAEGANFLAYLVVDGVVDSYFPLLDLFSDRLEDLEEDLFNVSDPRIVMEVFRLKKDVLQLRRLVTPLRDVFLVLLRGPASVFGPQTYVYFQDVLDHLLRISDAIDTYRDLMSSAVDVYLSSVSNRTNETMKKLTVLSTVLMSMALVSGVYGMNFQQMPELRWTYGYPYALGLMLVIGVVLTALFKWRRYI
jgi:magnesium transporter